MAVPLAYFTVSTSAFDHPKVRALGTALREQIPGGWFDAVVPGLLARLWALAASRGEDDGSLGEMTDQRLAWALGWGAEPETLVRALLECGLVEHHEDGLRVHDWQDAQIAVRKRISEREKRKNRGQVPPQGSAPDPSGSAPAPQVSAPIGRKVGRYSDPSPSEKVVDAARVDDPLAGLLDGIVAAWNRMAAPAGLPAVSKLTAKRRQHLRARVREGTNRQRLRWWEDYFASIASTPFCCGENDRGWRADFDFATRSEDSIRKVLEGTYERRPRAAQARRDTVADRLAAKAKQAEAWAPALELPYAVLGEGQKR